MAELITTLDLLRHGECEGGHIFRGAATDVALSENGETQMRQAVQRLLAEADDIPWQAVISSPLQRCVKFAEHLCQRHALSLQQHAGLRELHFGDWEGQAMAQVWQEHQQDLEQYFADPSAYTPPNGESTLDAAQRVDVATQELLHQYRGKHVLVVFHGGSMRLLLANLLHLPLASLAQWQVPYACVSRVQIFHRENSDWPVLNFHNLHGSA